MAPCKVLVSACLLGAPVRYDGGAFAPDDTLARWQAEGRVISLCPEMAGGLPTPRLAAEITAQGLVVNRAGDEVTAAFVLGAERALELARAYQIKVAVLKAKSPSCGNRMIYDGSFTGRLIEGQGITAKALMAIGIKVFNETELNEAEAYLKSLEA